MAFFHGDLFIKRIENPKRWWEIVWSKIAKKS